MEGMVIPGAPVMVSEVDPDSKRKLRYTLELLRVGRDWVGANTVMANRIVEALLRQRVLDGLKRYSELRREHRYGAGSRADFWMRRGQTQTFIEVKNCHLVYPDGRGYFPDSVSARASRHLSELVQVVRAGHGALVLLLVQHPRAKAVRPSDLHDPAFAEAARAARKVGVRFRAICVRPTPAAFTVEGEIPVDLAPYDTRQAAVHRQANEAWSGSQW
jgi:sugar fermentation stimulation protein A